MPARVLRSARGCEVTERLRQHWGRLRRSAVSSSVAVRTSNVKARSSTFGENMYVVSSTLTVPTTKRFVGSSTRALTGALPPYSVDQREVRQHRFPAFDAGKEVGEVALDVRQIHLVEQKQIRWSGSRRAASMNARVFGTCQAARPSADSGRSASSYPNRLSGPVQSGRTATTSDRSTRDVRRTTRRVAARAASSRSPRARQDREWLGRKGAQ